MQSYDLLIERIAKSSGLEKEEIDKRVGAKKAALSGLISQEGAAQIVAAELGVSFENQEMKISELMPGMRQANVVGKIINLFPVREFEKKGKQGKVVNFIFADETGNCRVVLWDTNHIALIESGDVKQGDVVEIKNGSVRDSEVHLGSFSEFKKSDKVMEDVKTEMSVQDKGIAELVVGQGVRVRGIVVQMFQPRFYSVCPECNKKVQQDAEGHKCEAHGKVQAKERAIVNFVLDDGEETVRVVLFSEQVNQLISEEDLKDTEKVVTFREDILGSEFFVSGNVKQNQLFNNTEVIAAKVEKVDVEKLILQLEGSS